jgi:hypothetical protein
MGIKNASKEDNMREKDRKLLILGCAVMEQELRRFRN